MEADKQIYRKALSLAAGDQTKRWSDNMNIGIKTMMVIPTETADLS